MKKGNIRLNTHCTSTALGVFRFKNIMKSGIYKLQWESGYFYYGQSINVCKRKKEHFYKMKSKKHYNKIIQNVFNKYGLPEFIIVELCDAESLTITEQIYISEDFNNSKCCNLCPAAGSQMGIKRSEETKRKLSISKKGKPSYKRTPNHNLMQSKRLTGIPKSESQKDKLRKANSGKKYSDETNKKKGSSRYGKDNAMYGKPSPLRKKVIKYNIDGSCIIYESMKEASKQSGLLPSHIRYKINNGIIFNYYDDTAAIST